MSPNPASRWLDARAAAASAREREAPPLVLLALDAARDAAAEAAEVEDDIDDLATSDKGTDAEPSPGS